MTHCSAEGDSPTPDGFYSTIIMILVLQCTRQGACEAEKHGVPCAAPGAFWTRTSFVIQKEELPNIALLSRTSQLNSQ